MMGYKTVGDCWGTLQLNGDGSGWEGAYTARTEWSAVAPNIFHVVDAEVLGSGENAGLRYIHRYEGTADSFTVTGQIEPFDDGRGGSTSSP